MRHLLSTISIIMLTLYSKNCLIAKGNCIMEAKTINEFTSALVNGTNRVNLIYVNCYKAILKDLNNLITYFKPTINKKSSNLNYKNININHKLIFNKVDISVSSSDKFNV